VRADYHSRSYGRWHRNLIHKVLIKDVAAKEAVAVVSAVNVVTVTAMSSSIN
jgi:hypothetical protein